MAHVCSKCDNAAVFGISDGVTDSGDIRWYCLDHPYTEVLRANQTYTLWLPDGTHTIITPPVNIIPSDIEIESE